jgi:CDP-diacylglycerol---serine O-phosphatidyltransferase
MNIMNKRNYIRSRMFILPSLFTLANMVCGFYSVILAINQRWLEAATLLTVAALMDGLDGLVARVTHSTSDFGLNFDSIVDVVSFGICPALIIYLKWLTPEVFNGNRFGWMIAFLYLMAGAIRLARFNVLAVHETEKKSRDFLGLPITAAALTLSTTLWVYSKYSSVYRIFRIIPIVIPGLIIVLTYLMMSNIKYPSLKRMPFKKMNTFLFFGMIIFLLILIMAQTGLVMFFIMLIYVMSGPAKKIYVIKKFSSRRQKNE